MKSCSVRSMDYHDGYDRNSKAAGTDYIEVMVEGPLDRAFSILENCRDLALVHISFQKCLKKISYDLWKVLICCLLIITRIVRFELEGLYVHSAQSEHYNFSSEPHIYISRDNNT